MKTLKFVSTYNMVIKKSKFIGFAYRVDSEQDAIEKIEEIKNKYYDAKHIVYAYKIGDVSHKENSSEPAGTAGTPILCAIENKNLSNTLVIVVRYFGGVLLGSSNLYRAYSDTAINVINANEILELNKFNKYKLVVSYIDYAVINSLSNKGDDVKILDAIFETEVTINIAVKQNTKNSLIENLIKDNNPLGELWL